MSNIQTLREFMNERLSAATEEIFGAVERRITGYEEEIERQRKLLDAVLKPHVKLIRRDGLTPDDLQLLPTCKEEDIEEGDTSEQQFPSSHSVTQDDPTGDLEPRGLEDTGSLQLVFHEEEEDVEDGDDDESPEQLEPSPVQHQEDPRESDHGTRSRLPSSQGNSPRNRGRSQKEATTRKEAIETYLLLKICVLTDPHMRGVWSKDLWPTQELKVPHDMQEAEFLDLLRSSFPELADNQPFDIFTTDRGRILCPLELVSLTPKDIVKSMKSAKSLYIRLKQTGETMKEGEQQEERRPMMEERRPMMEERRPMMEDTDPSRLETLCDENLNMGPIRRKERRPRSKTTLRVILLRPGVQRFTCSIRDGSVMQKLVVRKDAGHQDFVAAISHMFPELQGKEVEFCRVDHQRNVHNLPEHAITPSTISACGQMGRSSLYIREKLTSTPPAVPPPPPTPMPPVTSAPASPPRRTSPTVPPPPAADTELQSSQGHSARKGGKRRKEAIQMDLVLRICVITDPHISVLGTTNVFKMWPVEELKVPHDMQEAEFLDMLRSSFPELADNQPFDIFTTDRGRRLCPLELESLTPKDIFKSINSTGEECSALYIRLKAEVNPHTSEKELQLQDLKGATSKDDAFTSANDRAEARTRSHLTRIQTVEKASGDPRVSTSRADEPMETGESDDGQGSGALDPPSDSRVLSPDGAAVESEQNYTDEDGGQDDGDEDWQPDGNNESDEDGTTGESSSQPVSRKPRKDQVTRSGIKSVSRKSKYSNKSNPTVNCKVCNLSFKSSGRLIRHAWCHANDPERICGVCEAHFESEETLKSHFLTHRKHHVCKICGTSVLTTVGLRMHMSRHKEGKPHECAVCHKGFSQKGGLKAHMRIHTGEKPFLCIVCGKRFSHRTGLLRHEVMHTGERRYGCRVCGKHFIARGHLISHSQIHMAREKTHLCDICSKAFYARASLNNHMRSHTGEKPATCTQCGKSFSDAGTLRRHSMTHTGDKPHGCKECDLCFGTKSQLKIHMTIHTRAKPYLCKICQKAFRVLEHLKIHMRTHTGERPYQCSACDKAFTQSHCLKTHMKSHGTQ